MPSSSACGLLAPRLGARLRPARCAGRSIACGGSPAPSSAFSAASSSSTSDCARHRVELGGDVVACAVPLASSSAPRGEQLVDGAGAGLHLRGLVLGALDRHADVAHLLGDAGERLVDLGLRLGGGVRRLDRLLAGAEGLDLGLQPLRGEGQLLLLGLQLGVLRLRGRSICCCERRLGGSAPRGRGPRGPSTSALLRLLGRACRTAAAAGCICSSRRLRLVATSATPRRTFCSISSCRW